MRADAYNSGNQTNNIVLFPVRWSYFLYHQILARYDFHTSFDVKFQATKKWSNLTFAVYTKPWIHCKTNGQKKKEQILDWKSVILVTSVALWPVQLRYFLAVVEVPSSVTQVFLTAFENIQKWPHLPKSTFCQSPFLDSIPLLLFHYYVQRHVLSSNAQHI